MKFLLTVACLAMTFAAFQAAKTMGPVGNIITNSIFLCKEAPPRDELSLKIDLRSIDDKGTKAMFANLTSKIPLDNTIDYNLELQKWESGNWKKFYNVKGKLCVDLQKLLAKIWEKLRAATKPAVLVPCPVKPDKYVIDNFQLSSKDLTIPVIFYGRFMVTVQMSKNKKTIMCVQGEGVSQAP